MTAGKAIAVVAALLAAITVAGCAKPPLPVLTQTTQGEPVLKTEVLRSGARIDVPVGVDPADVIVIQTAGGAKGYLAKKPKRHLFEPQRFDFFVNAQAQAESMSATQPKPSYRWAWVTALVAIPVVAGVLLWGRLRGPLLALLGFFRRRR